MDIVASRNSVPIRLTDERWLHISERHSEVVGFYSEVLEAIRDPDAIYEGGAGELLAVRLTDVGMRLVVAYKETSREDGFIITAFLMRSTDALERRTRLWPL